MMKKIDRSTYKDYLKDTGIIIKELAIEAKKKSENSKSDFSAGYMAGFHRVVSLMQQQAEAFNIPLEDIGLDGIDADKDLI